MPYRFPSTNCILLFHNVMYYLYIYTTTTTTTTQCKLVYAQVVLEKRPPAQVAEGNHRKCRVSVCASCWNEKHHQRKLLQVRGTGHQHPTAQVGAGAATTCNLHMGTYMHRSCAHVQLALVVFFLVPLAHIPTCTVWWWWWWWCYMCGCGRCM